MTVQLPRRVLITGATGFIGSRLVEVLQLTRACEPVALIRSTAAAWRITRFPLQFVIGDLIDRKSVEGAISSCDAVVHLAFGDRAAAVKGTDNILRAAVRAGVSRFVHVSSVAVYGDNPPAASRSEDAPANRTANAYGNTKLLQEQLVRRYGKRFNLPYVILRPPNVYGPFSHFTTGLLGKIRSGRMAIVERGENPCNLVYVDNLVEAILLALWKSEAIRETFFVTDDAVTWEKCITDHATLINASVPYIKASEIRNVPQKRIWRDSVAALPRVLLGGEFRTVLRGIPLFEQVEKGVYDRFMTLPEGFKQQLRWHVNGPVLSPGRGGGFSWADNIISAQRRKVAHSSSKLKELLGYEAAVSYREGMRLTEEWLRFAHQI